MVLASSSSKDLKEELMPVNNYCYISTSVATDRTEKSQRQFNIAPQQFIVPQTKRHNYHGS